MTNAIRTHLFLVFVAFLILTALLVAAAYGIAHGMLPVAPHHLYAIVSHRP